MKKHLFFKKSLSGFVLILAIALLLTSNETTATNYQIIKWDDHSNASNVPYCQSDSIKCVPPAGVTGVYWAPALTTHGDTLVLQTGFNGQVSCF